MKTSKSSLLETAGTAARSSAAVPTESPETPAAASGGPEERAEHAPPDSDTRYSLAARASQDGLWDWDLIANRVHFSEQWKAQLGYGDDEIGSSPDEWFERIYSRHLGAVLGHLSDHLDGRTPFLEAEFRILHKDGAYRWMRSRGVAVRDENGKATRLAGFQTDITARKLAEVRLQKQSSRDGLTGLANRPAFKQEVESAIEQRQRTGGLLAVLSVGVDRFKLVNDSFGHTIGDHLLVTIADRLGECIGPQDKLARHGGDQFTILLGGLGEAAEASRVGERIHRKLGEPFRVGHTEMIAAVSVGVAISDGDCEKPSELLRNAETAMFRAKESGGSRTVVFNKSFDRQSLRNLQLEIELRHALAKKQFELHYQPIVSLETGEITACEALIRWNHPSKGLISPGEFIPLAEETGLIVAISEWTLRTACTQAKQWQHPDLGPVIVSVNISPRHLLRENVSGLVRQVLEATKLAPELLRLELTESALVDESDETVRALTELRDMGVRISLDDFGTGYSSLTYLRRFPLSDLKIDQSFVREIVNNPSDSAITSGLIALAHSLKLTVIAEGVETPGQLEYLRSQNCDEVQGHLMSPALNAKAITAVLAQRELRNEFLFPSQDEPAPPGRAETASPTARAAADRAS